MIFFFYSIANTLNLSQLNDKKMGIFFFIIYIVIHRQICFVLSELISVARQYLPTARIETRLIQTPSQRF